MTSLSVPNRRLRGIDRVLRHLSTGRSSVEPEAAALAGSISEEAVCLDVGANYGLYTLMFAAAIGPAGRVLSFEPLPGPHAFLARAVRWLGADNVTVSDQALGDRRGVGEMSLPRRRGIPVHGRSFITDEADGLGPNAEFRAERRLSVGLSTVDAVVRAAGLERVDLIKIDVEGYEPAVVRGAEWTLAHHRPTLLLEIERRHLLKFGVEPTALVASLARQGYEMAALWDGRWCRVDVVTAERRNYLFTPR
ncbi:MAG: FkbM family methyltransferase [Nitriliruptoraceae bacterium]